MSFSFLIVLMIFIVSLLLRSPQKKKKSAPVPSRPPVSNRKKQPHPPVFSQSKMQDFESNSPKNEDYFTYETTEPDSFESQSDTAFSQNTPVENFQQPIENEQQKNLNLKFDDEEIQKGIIYSIILKRPDF